MPLQVSKVNPMNQFAQFSCEARLLRITNYPVSRNRELRTQLSFF